MPSESEAGKMTMPKYALTIMVMLSFCRTAVGLELEAYRMVDLTHAYNSETIYWPTSPSKFKLETLAEGQTEGGWYYSAYSVCTPEHGGTHLDSPVHFAAGGVSTDELPLENLIAPAVVIDVSDRTGTDRDYRLSVSDVKAFESRHGEIEEGTVVLLRTGWSRYWPDVRAYLGDDTPGDPSHLSFPSFGAEATELLVEERGVALLGVDTASIDFGRSKDFPVHRIAASRNVAGLENLTNLQLLPPTGSIVIALPMKIEGGSGGPARVVALVKR
jgi:kynurenine formamidase